MYFFITVTVTDTFDFTDTVTEAFLPKLPLPLPKFKIVTVRTLIFIVILLKIRAYNNIGCSIKPKPKPNGACIADSGVVSGVGGGLSARGGARRRAPAGVGRRGVGGARRTPLRRQIDANANAGVPVRPRRSV